MSHTMFNFSCRFALAVCVCAAFAMPARASIELHRKTLPATVLILAQSGESMGFGAGAVIEREQRLVVTAAHVVADAGTIRVMFPKVVGDRVKTSAKFYMQHAGEFGITARVIRFDARRDVAILQLDTLPAEAGVLPLAAGSPREGESIAVVGNSSLNFGGVFGYVEGQVRNVYEDVDKDVRVIDSDIAVNHGDSGGPVVNLRGELSAIVSCKVLGRPNSDGTINANQQMRAHLIDVSEVVSVLAEMTPAPHSPEAAITQLDQAMKAGNLDWVIRLMTSRLSQGLGAERAKVAELLKLHNELQASLDSRFGARLGEAVSPFGSEKVAREVNKIRQLGFEGIETGGRRVTLLETKAEGEETILDVLIEKDASGTVESQTTQVACVTEDGTVRLVNPKLAKMSADELQSWLDGRASRIERLTTLYKAAATMLEANGFADRDAANSHMVQIYENLDTALTTASK